MKYSIRHIAEIVEGEFLQFREDSPVEHLLLDSRRLIFPATSLFFSLQGPRRDGSQFLEELYKRGVRNFVVQAAQREPDTEQRLRASFPDANIILVGSTLAA